MSFTMNQNAREALARSHADFIELYREGIQLGLITEKEAEAAMHIAAPKVGLEPESAISEIMRIDSGSTGTPVITRRRA